MARKSKSRVINRPLENVSFDNSEPVRMSFIFPEVFYTMLKSCNLRYGKDMTYIIMEAVNEWIMEKEGLSFDTKGNLVNNGHDK